MSDFVDCILEASDEIHYGFEPLMQEFVWGKAGDPALLKGREAKLRGYYNGILQRSKNIKAAYIQTRKWAKETFK